MLGSLALLPLLLGLTLRPSVLAAAEVWSDRTFAFSKAGNADYTLPANQDQITPLVWLTRAGTQGIFNIASELGYTQNVSPAGTEWATGDAINHASLTFHPWQVWNGNNPPAMLGVNAVVHLIAEDIYIDIRCDGWGVGPGGGGAFSYHRAVQPIVPTLDTSWGRLKTYYR